MTALALASVAVSAIIINRAVDTELRQFARRDLRFSATNAAEMAAGAYLQAGGWYARSVYAIRTVSRSRGDDLVILNASGERVIGSAESAPSGELGERAPVVVRGRRVGTIIASHAREGGIDSAATRLDRRLQARMSGLLLQAGIVAGGLAMVLGLLVALYFARPLQRLTEVARRM